jgi:hypothetical protein
MDKKGGEQWLQDLEPLPLLPAEFATDAGIPLALVEELVSTGRIGRR